MDCLLKKNIDILGSKQFDYLLGEYVTDNRAKFVKSRKDEDILTFTDDNGKEIYLNSRYNAISEATTWAEAISNEGSKLYLMYGLGNIMCLKALCNRIDQTSVVVVYEPFIDIAYKVLSNVDLEDIGNNLNVVLYVKGINDFDYVRKISASFNRDSIENAVYLQHPNYKNISLDEYAMYMAKIKETYASIIANQNFFDSNLEKMTATINSNMQYLKEFRTVDQYRGIFDEDTTAILVGAGPSLVKNIDLLKEVKGKAIIGATDTAVRKLLQHDIVPDFFASIDINKLTDVFDKTTVDIPIVMDLTSRKEIVDNQRSTRIVTGNGGEMLIDIYDRFGIHLSMIPTGGSVSCTVYSTLRLWGIKRIILIGQDFAFTGGKIHVDGVIQGEILDNKDKIYVEDNDGNLVETRFDYNKYLRWFETTIASETDCEVISATEGGAKVHGAKIMTLREAIDTYIKDKDVVDYEGIIKNMPPVLDEDNYKKAKDILNKKLEELDSIIRETERGIKIQKDIKRKIKKNTLTNKEFEKENAKMKNIVDLVNDYKDMETINRYMKEFADALIKITTDDDPIVIIDETIKWLQEVNQAGKEYRVDLKQIIANT